MNESIIFNATTAAHSVSQASNDSYTYTHSYTCTPNAWCASEDLERLELKSYIDDKLKQQAERTYDIVSKLIQWNIDKEEFVNLLLSDEEG